MIRATTPKHSFIFDTDPSEYDRILITYAQKDYIIIEKQKEDLIIEAYQGDDPCFCGKDNMPGYVAWFRLTQEETNAFSSKDPVKVQVRVLTTSGEALASDEKIISVRDVLNDEVLT